jgi:DNA replication protein DnaC
VDRISYDEFLSLTRGETPEQRDERLRLRDLEIQDRLRQRDREYRIAIAKRLSQVGPRFAERTLATYHCPPGDPNALSVARAIVAYPYETGAWFHGDAGTGKTHLAAGIVNAITSCGTPAAFVSVLALLDQLKASYDRSGALRTQQVDVIRWLSQIDVLVLDDLDKAEFTSYVSQRLYALINQRYENGGSLRQKPVIVTSNRGPADLNIAWSKKGLDPVIGGAILDRLSEMCKQYVRVEGDSYRERLMDGVS